ncbi:MAG: PAS domain S-box protein, partial [Deltaproteobacteria bacterium]|nr:PAS domain S-box protein [Deltaproteobacteria bacterium]
MAEKLKHGELQRRIKELEKESHKHKKAEKVLREEKEFATSLIDNAPTFFVAIDVHGKIIMMNQNMLKTLGYKADEVVGKDYLSTFIPERDRDMLVSVFNNLTAKHKHTLNENHVYSKDGREFLVEWHGTPVFGTNGELKYFYGIGINITDRKRVEEALRESEDKYKSLTNNLNVGIYRNTVGPKGKFLEANPAIVKMFGFDTREEFLKVRVSDLYSNPSDRNEFSAKILKAGAVRNEELPLVKRNGTLFIGSVSAVVVKDDKGKAKYYDGIIEDITERKRTDEELRENEFFLKETQKVARLGGWKLNPEMDFLVWTEGVYDIIEAPLDYKPGLKEGLKYYVPEYLPALQERIQRCYSHGDPFAEECELITESGKRLWTEVRGVARIVEGKTAYVYGTFQDITERKQAQEALKESEKKYRQIYNNIIDVYYEANVDGIILEISPSIEKNSKYKREELIGKSLYDVYTNPEERSKLIEALIKDGSVNEYEINLTDKDDTQHICSINSMLIKDKNGNPIKIVGIMRDISDRKKAEKEKLVLEEKLFRSKKMESLGLLAGGVAHDLNNVLSGIVSYPELILMDLPEDSKFRKRIETIQESGQRAAAIVQDLLTVARGVATTKEALNLNELIGDYLHSPEFKKLKQF